MSNGLRNWSISGLLTYETCAFRIKLSKIERLPEPPRPANDPLERGTREHDRYDRHVKGEKNALVGAEAKAIDKFSPLLDHGRKLITAQMATAEQDWFFNENWELCSREDRWLWVKLDFNAEDQENRLVVPIDYKTGKSAYKVIDHIQQLQLYGAVSALKYEWADRIITELWYVDEGWIRSTEYTREQALSYVGRFQARADRMMSDKHFRPNPNKQNCRWCPYSPRGTGACPVGV